MKRLLVWLALLALCLAPCARAENPEPEFTIPPPGVSMLEKKAELEEQERLNATEPPPKYSQEQIDALPDEVIKPLIATIPLGRMGEPEDIADAVVFLASDMASYISGVVLPVDGLART